MSLFAPDELAPPAPDTCGAFAADVGRRTPFDWQPPPGVSIDQRHYVYSHDDQTGKETYGTAFTARCCCGLESDGQDWRANALEQLAERHRAVARG